MPTTPSLDPQSLLFIKTVIFHRLPQKDTLIDVTDIVLDILFCSALQKITEAPAISSVDAGDVFV